MPPRADTRRCEASAGRAAAYNFRHGTARTTRTGRHPYRHLGLALRTLARHLLSAQACRSGVSSSTPPSACAPSRSTARSIRCRRRRAIGSGVTRPRSDFVFSVKGGRYITHMKRLLDVRVPLGNFFASGMGELGTKLGPFLWQFPPNFAFDAERVEAFLALLPPDTDAATRLARSHDDKLRARGPPRLRTAATPAARDGGAAPVVRGPAPSSRCCASTTSPS